MGQFGIGRSTLYNILTMKKKIKNFKAEKEDMELIKATKTKKK